MPERISSVLQYYSEPLFDVFQQECGDGIGFWDAEDGFENYLSHRRFQLGPYNDIKNLNATSEEAVEAFRQYLGGGRNCPDTSLRGQAGQIAENFLGSAHKMAFSGEDGNIRYTSDPEKMYANWQKYLGLYLEAVQLFKIAADRFAGEENLDFLVLNDLRTNANRAEIIAREMDLRLKEIRNVDFLATPEGTAIKYHYQRINNFRGIVRFIAEATESVSRYAGLLDELVDIFQGGVRDLHNPFDWISKVTIEIFKETKAKVDLKVPEDRPLLRTESTMLMWELLDRVAMSAVEEAGKKGSDTLSFKWDPFKRHFVILASNLGQQITRVDQLLALLKGSRSGVSPVEIRVPVKTVSLPAAGGSPAGDVGPQNEMSNIDTADTAGMSSEVYVTNGEFVVTDGALFLPVAAEMMFKVPVPY